jgi:hypothetical protein
MKAKLILFFIIIGLLSISCDKATESDNTPPTVVITYPANNSEFVEGTMITITVNATDNKKIKEVRFYIDGVFVFLDESEPYKYLWDTGTTKFTTHTIYAKAYDTSDNSATSEIITVTLIEGNAPPNQPSNPSPSNNSISIPIDADLYWECSDPDGDPLTYDVYFGTSSNPPLMSEGQSETTYDLGIMNYDKTYYWRIVAHDDHSNEAEGDVWEFTTYVEYQADWQWVIKAGGSSWDEIGGITIDELGNIFITGYFRETATFGSYSLTSYGYRDIFVAKVDANGNWQWAAKAGGSDGDNGNGITIDDAGNTYVTGYFEDTATFGSQTLISYGDCDIFVAKLDANGNWLWATKAGGGDCDDIGLGITIDDDRNTYITGYYEDTATFGSHSLTSYGYRDIFVAKVDANGNWKWAANAGGISNDYGNGVAIDDAGNTYITGYFKDTATLGSQTLISYGDRDIFLAKVNASGNWQWAANAGGSDFDAAYGITIDDAGNTYITGSFGGTATFGSQTLISYGDCDVFVAKVDENGNWQWATKAGVNYGEVGWVGAEGIAIDDFGNTYVTGSFNYKATFGSYPLTSYGWLDIFVAKIGENGLIKNINNKVNSKTNIK